VVDTNPTHYYQPGFLFIPFGIYTALDVMKSIIATGAQIRPDQTEGLLDENWHQTKFDFYTVEGAVALRKALQSFEGGRVVVNVVEMPIKCPVAPLEFLFLADTYFRETSIRDKVDLQLVTSLPRRFQSPRRHLC
jgi:sulfide:quinone oxidoreductase